MALSGSVLCPTTEQLVVEFVWNGAQDAVAGGTWIYWVIFLRAGPYGRTDAWPGADWRVELDGQVFSGDTDITIAANSAKQLAAGSVFLKHDAFGEKSFDFSFYQYLNVTLEGTWYESVSGSGSAVLDRLDPDVAPIVDRGTVYLGETLRITPQGPLGATYRLRYALGAAEGVIGEGLTGPVDWVVPVKLGNQFPYTEKSVLRILCDAYRDGEPVGRAREAAVTVLVPESAVPTVEEFIWKDVSPAASLGLLLQNVSCMSTQVQAVGAMGSLLVRCDVTLNGKPLDRLTEAGDQEILVTVTDSRGRVGVHRETVSVMAYRVPWVRVSGHRCLVDGNADDTGEFAEITVEAQWVHLGQAQLVLSVAGTEEASVPGQEWLEGKSLGDPVGGVILKRLVEAPVDSPLEVSAWLSDGISRGEHGMALSTGYCIMDVFYGGQGVTFGAAATEPGFVCAMDAKFTGRVILPDGTDLMERLQAIEN